MTKEVWNSFNWHDVPDELAMDSDKKTTRVQIEMPGKALARLQSLKEKTEATSYSEVVKNALRLYEFMVDTESEGYVFQAQHPEGKSKAIQMFFGSTRA